MRTICKGRLGLGTDGGRRNWLVIVFMVSLCVLLSEGLARRQTREDLLSVVDGSSFGAFLEMNGEMAEYLWINCRRELIQIQEVVESVGIFFPERISTEQSKLSAAEWSITKNKLLQIINVLPSQMQETFLDCLSKRSSSSLVSGGDDNASQNWLVRYIQDLIGWRSSRRRILAHQVLLSPILTSPAPGPSASPPGSSHASSPAEAPVEDWSFPPDPPDAVLDPSTDQVIAFSPDFPPPFVPSEKTGGGGSSKRTIIVAVVLTAVGTFTFALILFCCYQKYCTKSENLNETQKDERPLLNLPSSDYSAGSSQKSFVLGNAMESERFENVHSKFTTNSQAPSLEVYPILNGKPSLPLPPAAVAAAIDASKSSTLHAAIFTSNTDAALSPAAASSKSSAHAPPGPTNKPSAPPPPPPPPMRPTPARPNTTASSTPPPPPIPTGIKTGPHQPPPAPPKAGSGPPRPPVSSKLAKPSPLGKKSGVQDISEASKPKLKPFFWDKVLANPDHSMVWHQLKAGSFQFNEEMIETLFGYNNSADRNNKQKKETASFDPVGQYVQILEPKKSQNLSILLRALNVTVEEVCDALTEGNELPVELLQTFLKMAPTPDEELKIRLYIGELSQLLPAERFLKALVEIPFAFKRMDALLYVTTLQEEVSGIKESFVTLEVACKELRSSRLFLKLLEAVLKTGNRMNDGTFRGGAQAFKLDTLLKLSDVKGTDGKTTLLHFVVQEIIRSEGVRRARALQENTSLSSFNSDDLEDTLYHSNDDYLTLGLQVVAGLSGELENVKKAALLDADVLTGTVAALGQGHIRVKEFLNKEMRSMEEHSGFQRTLESCVEHAEGDVTWLLGEEKRIKGLVKSITDYFHGNSSKDEGFRLFVIVRDFLSMLDKVCNEVKEMHKKMPKMSRTRESPAAASPIDHRQLLFPAIKERRIGDSNSSSDDDS